jgi:hypothetical protein
MPEATSSRDNGQDRTDEQDRQPRELAEGNAPAGVMSVKLGKPHSLSYPLTTLTWWLWTRVSSAS